jgi:transcriptional regulator with XRE-family HTH domain
LSYMGDRLKALRKERFLSQEELARRSFYSLNTVARLERGETFNPHLTLLMALASGLGMPLGELVEDLTNWNYDKEEAREKGYIR